MIIVTILNPSAAHHCALDVAVRRRTQEAVGSTKLHHEAVWDTANRPLLQHDAVKVPSVQLCVTSTSWPHQHMR